MSDEKLRKLVYTSTARDSAEELKAYLNTITNIHYSYKHLGAEGAKLLAAALAKTQPSPPFIFVVTLFVLKVLNR